ARAKPRFWLLAITLNCGNSRLMASTLPSVEALSTTKTSCERPCSCGRRCRRQARTRSRVCVLTITTERSIDAVTGRAGPHEACEHTGKAETRVRWRQAGRFVG